MNFEKCFGLDLDVDNFYLHLKKFKKILEPIDGLLILYTHLKPDDIQRQIAPTRNYAD